MTKDNDSFSMIQFIKDTCEEIGPRFSTTEGERKAGLKIKGIMAPLVDSVDMEDFKVRPRGMLDSIKIMWIFVLVGTVVFPWLPWLSMGLYLLTVLAFVFEEVLLVEFLDFLFPKGTGTSVVGKILPKADRKHLVIFSAHHDSAYEFPLFAKFKSGFGTLAYSTVGCIIGSMLVALINFILGLTGFGNTTLTMIFMVVPVLAVILLGYVAFNIHSQNLIPGANDNLSGVSIVLSLAHHFSKAQPEHVELWFVSFSSEECLRGSKRFVTRHASELGDALLLNFDSTGVGTVTISSGEAQHGVKHSMELARQFQAAARATGKDLPIADQAFGGTDAVFFSKKGIKAITIIGLMPEHYPDIWHEMRDTPEHIDQSNLDVATSSAIEFVKGLDSA